MEEFEIGVTAEFNFRRDSPYVLSFTPANLAAASGDALFERVIAFHSARFGAAQVKDEHDDPYSVKSREWASPGCEVGVINPIVDAMKQVGWGYRVPIKLGSAPGRGARWLSRERRCLFSVLGASTSTCGDGAIRRIVESEPTW